MQYTFDWVWPVGGECSTWYRSNVFWRMGEEQIKDQQSLVTDVLLATEGLQHNRLSKAEKARNSKSRVEETQQELPGLSCTGNLAN